MLLTFSSSSCLWFLVISSLFILCLCNQDQDEILCKATERSALIQFKNKLHDRANRLSSWSGNDCCSWSGVVCDNFTGHVLEIRLRGPDDGIKGHCHGSYDTDDELEEASKQMLGGNISSSLIKLVQLRHLDLSCNDFGFGPVPAFIGSLKNLTYLNMSKSQFGGEVPQKLGSLSRLRVLALQDDKIFSNLHSNNLSWLRNLKQLQHLDMAGVNLAEASDWLQAIQAAVKEKKMDPKTNRQIIDDVMDSQKWGHIAGVGRVVLGTGSSSRSSQVDQGFYTQEEIEEVKKQHAMELQEQKKLVKAISGFLQPSTRSVIVKYHRSLPLPSTTTCYRLFCRPRQPVTTTH